MNFTDIDSFSDVHVLDTTEQVLGGSNSAPANVQAQALANRTRYLLNRLGGRAGISSINVTADASVTLDLTKLGFLTSISVSNNIAATLTLTLPDPSTVKAGQGYLLNILDNDTSVILVAVNSGVFYNNQLIGLVSDGSASWTTVIYTSGNSDSFVPASVENPSGNIARVRLPKHGNGFNVPTSSLLNSPKVIQNIALQGDKVPRNGLKIRLQFAQSCLIGVLGNITLPNNNQSNGTVSVLSVAAGDYLNFIYLSGPATWVLIDPNPSLKPLNGISETSDVTLSGAYPSVIAWFNKLIAFGQSLFNSIAAATAKTFTVNGTVNSAQISVTSANTGALYSYTSGTYDFTSIGNLNNVFVRLFLTLSGTFNAGDSINIDMSALIRSPAYNTRGLVTAHFASSFSNIYSGDYYFKIEGTTLKIYFNRLIISDNTILLVFNASISYLS